MLMIHTHPNAQRITLAEMKRQALLLVGLLLLTTVALAGENPADLQTGHWTSSANDLELLFSRDEDTHVVCPHLQESAQQPFCREFAADLLSVCGDRNALQLVLANGEIHRVDSALIGIDGSFEPAHRPDQPLDLIRAWLPGEECELIGGLADVVGTESNGDLWHFNGTHWKQVAVIRTTRSVDYQSRP